MGRGAEICKGLIEDKEIKDTSRFFTNDLIDEINKFDRQEIVEQAKNFKLPYKS